jgi:tRNA pseudouridine55 synthase
LYYYARKGIEVEKEPRRVSIIELERVGDLNDLTGDYPELTLRVVCSKGTYIRTLGADIGDALGFGAYLTDLRRTRSGPFCIDKAVDGGQLTNPEEREMILEKMLSVEDVGNLLQ